MSLPCDKCPVIGIDQVVRAEASDDPMVQAAARVARTMLERGDRGERAPLYAGIEVDLVSGEDLGPRFECCNRHASLAATVVGVAMRATHTTPQY